MGVHGEQGPRAGVRRSPGEAFDEDAGERVGARLGLDRFAAGELGRPVGDAVERRRVGADGCRGDPEAVVAQQRLARVTRREQHRRGRQLAVGEAERGQRLERAGELGEQPHRLALLERPVVERVGQRAAVGRRVDHVGALALGAGVEDREQRRADHVAQPCDALRLRRRLGCGGHDPQQDLAAVGRARSGERAPRDAPEHVLDAISGDGVGDRAHPSSEKNVVAGLGAAVAGVADGRRTGAAAGVGTRAGALTRWGAGATAGPRRGATVCLRAAG